MALDFSYLSIKETNADDADDESDGIETIIEEVEREKNALEEKKSIYQTLVFKQTEIIKESQQELKQFRSQIRSKKKYLLNLGTEEREINEEVQSLAKDICFRQIKLDELSEKMEKRRKRLENMKCDLFRENVKRHINILHKITNARSNLKEVQLDKKQIAADKNSADELFRTFTRRILRHVEFRNGQLVKLEKYQRKLIQLELESNPVPPYAGAFNAIFEFIENGTGEFEETDPDFINIQLKYQKFNKLLTDQRNLFKYSPIGPFYSYVSVKDKKWMALVERILRSHLFAFIVDNESDKTVLEDLIKQFFNSSGTETDEFAISSFIPTVHVIRFESEFQTFEGKVTGMKGLEFDCVNLMDSMQIDCGEQQVWENFLATVTNAERIVLFHTEHEAFVLMHQQGASSTTRRVDMAYSLDGFQIFPFPDFKTSTIQLPKRAVYMKVLVDTDITILKEQICETESLIALLQRNVNEYKQLQLKTLQIFEENKEKLESIGKLEKSLLREIGNLNISISSNLTIEGEEYKMQLSQAKLTALKATITYKQSVREKGDARLQDIHSLQLESLKFLEEMEINYNKLKDEYDDNISHLKMEASILTCQIKSHQKSTIKLEDTIVRYYSNKNVDLNNNNVSDKHGVSSSVSRRYCPSTSDI